MKKQSVEKNIGELDNMMKVLEYLSYDGTILLKDISIDEVFTS